MWERFCCQFFCVSKIYDITTNFDTVPHNIKPVTYKQFVFVVLLLSHVWLFLTPWIAACQTSLSFTISWLLLKLMFIESVILSNHLILCCCPPPTSSPVFNLSQYQSLFHRVDTFDQVAKVLQLQLQHQSFQWIFRIDFL